MSACPHRDEIIVEWRESVVKFSDEVKRLAAAVRRSTIKIMTYSASREDVKSVLEWLQGDDKSQDDRSYIDHTNLLSQAISELQRMPRPILALIKPEAEVCHPM